MLWMEEGYARLNPYLNRLVIAILILLIGFILGKLLGRFVRRVLDELGMDAALKKTVGIKVSVSKVVSAFSAFVVYFVTIVLFLNSLGLTTVVLNAISIGVILLIMISIALAIRDFVPNLAAGLTMHTKQKIKVGDHIEMEGIKGKVVEVSLLDTQIRTASKDIVFIPNAILIKNILKKK